MPDGLRERKKQRTRETIVAAALRLFDERGFDGTTVADIAHAADIAPRTFFGYFAAKEDVVFHQFAPTFGAFTARVTDRAQGETAVDALRDWIAGLIETVDFDDPSERLRRRLIRATPALQEHDRALLGRFEQVLSVAVAQDLGLPEDALRPRMVAAAGTAALGALSTFYDEHADRGTDPLVAVDEALVFLRGGIAALQQRPPATR